LHILFFLFVLSLRLSFGLSFPCLRPQITTKCQLSETNMSTHIWFIKFFWCLSKRVQMWYLILTSTSRKSPNCETPFEYYIQISCFLSCSLCFLVYILVLYMFLFVPGFTLLLISPAVVSVAFLS
jgi:hypothetical protein